MASVKENIAKLDKKVAELETKMSKSLARAERRLLIDLEDAVGRREVRQALNLLGNFEKELNASSIKDLRDSVSTIYGNIAADVREVFKSADIPFKLGPPDVANIADITQADFDLLESHVTRYSRVIKSDVLRTTFAGGDIEDIEGIIDSARETFLRNLKADSVNVVQGFRNALTVSKAKEEKIEQLEYAGPEDDKNRPFCAEHVGNTYTIAEVEDMTNDDGMPALTDMGGYNCRHEWRPVSG